jgi:hypothetical protein
VVSLTEFSTQLTCELSNISAGMRNLDDKIDDMVELLKDIEKTYQKRDTVTKQHIVSSIFPTKLVFDNKKVRTLEINKVLSLICSIDNGFKENKKRKHTEFGVLSRGVEQRKPISNNLRQEIELLANCYREITSSIPNPKTDIK